MEQAVLEIASGLGGLTTEKLSTDDEEEEAVAETLTSLLRLFDEVGCFESECGFLGR